MNDYLDDLKLEIKELLDDYFYDIDEEIVINDIDELIDFLEKYINIAVVYDRKNENNEYIPPEFKIDGDDIQFETTDLLLALQFVINRIK